MGDSKSYCISRYDNELGIICELREGEESRIMTNIERFRRGLKTGLCWKCPSISEAVMRMIKVKGMT